MRERLYRSMTGAMAAVMVFASVVPTRAEGEGSVAQDPPGLVGRIARISGTVSYHGDGATQWEQAQVNYPISSGAAVWTQPDSNADLDIGPNRVTLDQGTEFDVESLTDQQFTSVAPQGRVYLRVRDLPAGQHVVLRTPRGTVTLAQPGRYEIVAGDTQSPTLVTVQDGLAQVSGPGVSLAVGARQTAQITGDDVFQGQVGPEASDGFLAAQVARDQPTQFARRYDPPPVVQQMTGYDAVAETGEWTSSTEYGRVWYPPVEHDWVPYRHGRWAFVAPWGWTWVDDAPWGFAPFHYGRWVEIDNRWAWTPVVPGYVERSRPVYAPALVAFVGLGVGVGIGVGIGASVGWIPLGPREVYRPPYRVSNNYVRSVNVTNVTNVTNITNYTTNITNTRYVNNRAATSVPQTALTQSQPVAGLARPVSAQALATAQPLAQVQPTRTTRGVTPAVAQSLNLPASTGPAPVARPGPPIHSVSTPAAAPVGTPAAGQPAGQRAGLPPVPGSGRPGAVAPAVPSVQPAVSAPAPVAQPTPAPVQTFGRPSIRPPGGLAAPGAGQPVPAPGQVTPLQAQPGTVPSGIAPTTGQGRPGQTQPSPGLSGVAPVPGQGRPVPTQPVPASSGAAPAPGQVTQAQPSQPSPGPSGVAPVPAQGRPAQAQPSPASSGAVPAPGQVTPAQAQPSSGPSGVASAPGLGRPAQTQPVPGPSGVAPAPGQPVIPRPAGLPPAAPASGGYTRPAAPTQAPTQTPAPTQAAPQIAPRPAQPAATPTLPPVVQRQPQPVPAAAPPQVAPRPIPAAPAPQPQSQPQFRPQSQPQPQPQFHPQSQPQSQPQFHPQSQPQPQPQFHPQSQPQPQFRPQPQPQSHPQPAPQVQHQAPAPAQHKQCPPNRPNC